MILTTHALVGAALGKHISNLWILTALAIPLHFFLDTFRHGEYLNKKSTFKSTWWKVTLDLLTGGVLVFGYISFSGQTTNGIKNILFGSFISMFPDLLTVLYWKLNFKFLNKVYQFHQKMHKYPDMSPEREFNLRNSINDIIFSLLAILFLFIF